MSEKTKQPINRILFNIDSNEDTNEIGVSHLGGVPDVDSSFVWPIHKGSERPYSFIGQFNFEQIKPFDKDNKLPYKGLLLVFLDKYSALATKNGSAYLPKLIYIENTSSLKRYEGSCLDKQLIKIKYSHLVFFNTLSYYWNSDDENLNNLNRILDFEACEEDCHDCYFLGYESSVYGKQETHKPLIQLMQLADFNNNGIRKFFFNTLDCSCHIFINENDLKNKDFSNIEFEAIIG